MRTTRPQKVVSIPFKEGVDLDQIPFQLGQAVRKLVMTIKGTVTIASKTGTILPAMGADASGKTVLWPYLLALVGKISFQGTRKDSAKGLKWNNIPAWFFWLDYFLKTGISLNVDDGGMAAASFAAGTYDIEINVPMLFYDPLTPEAQHPFTYFRPPCYNSKPVFQVTGGTLFQEGYQGNRDDIALGGETTTPSTLDYTLDLTVEVGAYTVPDLIVGANDKCGDRSFEYFPLMDATPSDYNGINLSDLELQQYLWLISTNLVPVTGAKNAFVEAGSAGIIGAANNGIIERQFGSVPYMQPYVNNQISEDQAEFMKAGSLWPTGLVLFDDYGHNWSQWKTKTCLKPGLPQNLLQAYGTPDATNGSNFRVVHETVNLSATAKKGVNFPTFAVAKGIF